MRHEQEKDITTAERRNAVHSSSYAWGAKQRTPHSTSMQQAEIGRIQDTAVDG